MVGERLVKGIALGIVSLALLGLGCYKQRPSEGGGQLSDAPDSRQARAQDVMVPAGYSVEVVATGLTFPTGVAIGEGGELYVTESGYSYGEVLTEARVVRINDDGQVIPIYQSQHPPLTGIASHDGALFVAEGGHMSGGRVVRLQNGAAQVLVDKLPSLGDHHTNGPAISRDGWVYFGQGTATNSAVVGPDNHDFGWLSRNAAFHDTPCADVRLTGVNFSSNNPLEPQSNETVSTGAFVPFGTETEPGQVIPGSVPCNGAVMRVRREGGPVELVAWGFRNPFGLAFSADGELFVTDNGFDLRGSRPVFGAADLLWRIDGRHSWFGWPDYSGVMPLSSDRFHQVEPEEAPRTPVIEQPPGQPPLPVARLAVHSSSNGFDFSTSPSFGHVGHAFIAQFGDQAPTVGKVLGPVGYKVVRVDPQTGIIQDFARNVAGAGPASRVGSGGLERPIAARFDPAGTSLYVVDFGILTMSDEGAKPRPGTGVVWRITRKDMGR